MFEPRPAPLPRVGARDRVRVEEQRRDRTLQQVAPGEEPLSIERSRRLKATYVREVAAVSSAAVDAYRLRFEHFSAQDASGVEDRSLEGLTIALRRDAAGRLVWSAPPEASLSTHAKGFLDRRARALAAPLTADLLPTRAVPINGSWPVAPALLAQVLGDVALNDEESTASVRLVDLVRAPSGGSLARFVATGDLRLARIPGTAADEARGRARVAISFEHPIGGRPSDDDLRVDAKLSAEGFLRRPDGRSLRLEIDGKQDLRVEVEPLE